MEETENVQYCFCFNINGRVADIENVLICLHYPVRTGEVYKFKMFGIVYMLNLIGLVVGVHMPEFGRKSNSDLRFALIDTSKNLVVT